MASETIVPNSLDVQTNLSGAVTDIDDDPDSPDGNWLTATSSVADSICRVSFGTPSGNLNTGADLQEFRILWRSVGNGASPDAINVYLYENGSVVGSAIYTAADPLPGTGEVISATWNAADLGNIDGSLVECHVVVTADVAPGPQESTGEIGAIEWNVDYDGGGLSIPILMHHYQHNMG